MTQTYTGEDLTFDRALRPRSFADYVGQVELVEKLHMATVASRHRGESLEHILLDGPAGLGKTTLAHVIGNELGTKVHCVNAPALSKGGDIAGILSRLRQGDVLFIDEVHRLPAVVEEYLYPAMEDHKIDITLGKGMKSRTRTIRIAPFTLIGATTRSGLISAPMRSRFGMHYSLDFYVPPELGRIVVANAAKLDLWVDAAAVGELAQRSRGTPRITNRLLRRSRDYATVYGNGRVTHAISLASLELEGVDSLGLTVMDRTYLQTIITSYNGGPVGIEVVAATLQQDPETLQDVCEPYMLRTGLLLRTKQGREVTQKALDHILAQ